MTKALQNQLKALAPLLLFFGGKIDAQSNVKITTTDSIVYRTKDPIITSSFQKPQVVYANLFGEGSLLSINYDRRFKKQNDGWGWHAGIGGLVYSDWAISMVEINLPVGINYLIGKKGNFLELGINESIVYDNLKQEGEEYNNSGNLYGITISAEDPHKLWSFTSGTIGYRRQPKNSGFCFRVGILPFIAYIDGKLKNPNPNQSVTGYMSFGYKF